MGIFTSNNSCHDSCHLFLGYVLNKESLERFVKIGLKDASGKFCKVNQHHGNEDVEIGRCMKHVGVSLGDTLDEHKRQRFLPLQVEKHLIPGTEATQKWYMTHSLNPKDVRLMMCFVCHF